MSMNAIFASKLYRASKHKDKIKAALANPINTELVTQLKEYLNENDLDTLQEQVDEVEDTISDESALAEDAEESEKEVIRPSTTSSKPAPPKSAPDHHLSEAAAEVDKERDEALNPEKKTFEVQSAPESAPESESKDVEESVRLDISATPVTASDSIVVIPAINTSLSVDSIIGALNARDDTKGVCRAIIKDSEIWIHYNDNINLNNVMEPAIALLNAAGYGNLDFNRLARTENAIVFTISPVFKQTQPLKGHINE